jgi:NAD(P)H-hydrate repair Nnr-like enzyme with NAD(P)H-hydrate epimerase domain
MSLLGRSATLVASVLVLLTGIFGCGGTQLDASKVEDQLEANIENTQGKKVSSVDCPSGVEVEPGKKFSCTVHLSGGGTETATLLIRDKDANVSFLNLKANE